MKRTILTTSDGSTTIRIEDWDECYHSIHGAIQEAKHVFIKNGLSLFETEAIAILEIGFGTGLNALISFLEANQKKQYISYVGVEAYPIDSEEVNKMNFAQELEASIADDAFNKMHACPWEEKFVLNEYFDLTKRKQFFQDINDSNLYDLIYFDAFGYRVQPELWNLEIFQKMYNALKENGVLVTYAARGVIKRNMIEAGFTVVKLPGPPGKREMFRATKELPE